MNNKSASKKPFDFSGSAAAQYDYYLGPLFFEPYAIEVANRIDASVVETALELAAGTGIVTRHLWKLLSKKARLIASDISTDMLEIAKEKLKGENIEWQIIDANKLPFEDNSIDLIVCCFGYMFVPDRIRAYSEALRVLKPNGMLLISTWDKLETSGISSIYRDIVKKYLPGPLPESYRLPTSMHDDVEIKNNLEQVGFSRIWIAKVKKLSYSPSAKFATEALTQGGVIYDDIMRINPAWMDEIRAELEKQLTAKFGSAPMTAPMSALITQAWK